MKSPKWWQPFITSLRRVSNAEKPRPVGISRPQDITYYGFSVREENVKLI
jgi:hypothetical protein